MVAETEKLRSALLSSVSHDLRSPLAAMIGSADTLKYYGEQMPESDRHELLDTIHIEGERLDRYIQNLLDMTRLGHQGLTLSRAWVGVDELIGSATQRLKRYQPEVKIEVALAEELPQLYVHPALIEQAISNVFRHEEDTHYLRILVKKLRSKIGDSAVTPKYIFTIAGVGLLFQGQS